MSRGRITTLSFDMTAGLLRHVIVHLDEIGDGVSDEIQNRAIILDVDMLNKIISSTRTSDSNGILVKPGRNTTIIVSINIATSIM